MADNDFTKGGAYFKDPGTLQLLTGNEPREVECHLTGDGKFVWPQIKLSNGTVGKLVYSLWTAEEKATYKQYRAKGPSAKKEKSAVRKESIITDTSDTEEPVKAKEPNYTGSTASGKMLAYIRNCDKVLGTWNMDGTIHDLLTIEGSNSYMPVPRCLIPKEDRIRLNIS